MIGVVQEYLRKRKYGPAVVVVSGLPRSGTSMMMKMLEAAGLLVMTDAVRQADEDNPKGYFEYERVKDLEKDPDKAWVREARGRVLKVISFLLKDLPPDNFYRIVFVHRDIDEVVASQNKMLHHRGEENRVDDEEARRLFQRHLLQVKMLVSRSPNVEMFEVDHREAIQHPRAVAEKVSAFLGGGLDVDAMAAVVDRTLYRNRKEDLAASTST
ncbi:MAG: sulfotransferase domain-containing protein [Deltaproteobacteria bacterium]|nr:sulfotransferase domain-containing protein [Deltaproteobacteria bacterium]